METRRSQRFQLPLETLGPEIVKRETRNAKKQAKTTKAPPKKKARKAFGDITNSPTKTGKKVASKKSKCPEKDLKAVVKDCLEGTNQCSTSKSLTSEKTSHNSKAKRDNVELSHCSKTDGGKQFDRRSSEESMLTSSQGLPSSEEVLSSEELSSSQEVLSSQEIPSSQEVVSLQELPSSEEILMSQELPSSQDSVSSDGSKSDVSVSSEEEDCDVIEFHESIDTETDPAYVAEHAEFVFTWYYKMREAKFTVRDYMGGQREITISMRAILVDWMVEVQESFELNHETLYLAVKLMDLMLASTQIWKDDLQLVGATSLLIAAKFDERMPPSLDDFVYICDEAYKKKEILAMERKLLPAVDYDLGAPLSYSYLRRYAKCARQRVRTLTLARYILETSLMDYQYALMSDSLLAAAALLLAMKMLHSGTWTSTLRYYAKFKEEEVMKVVVLLNQSIKTPKFKNTKAIRNKYSHSVFLEVALIPPLDL